MVVSLLLGAIFCLAMHILTVNRLGDYDTLEITAMSVSVFGMGVCVMLILTLLLDSKINLGAIYFFLLVVIDFFALMSNMLNVSLSGDGYYTGVVTVTQYLNPALLYCIMLVAWLYIGTITGPRNRTYLRLEKVFFVFFALGLLLLFVNVFTGNLFIVTRDAITVPGPDRWLMQVPFVLMTVAGLIGLSRIVYATRQKLALALFFLAPISSLLLDLYFNPIGTTNIVFGLLLLVIYGNFYVGRSKELIMKDAELMDQRAKILISQIQPHFLYNSLTSIMNIKGNPPATREAISEFGLYLRGNMDSLKKSGPISIRDEINHVETYIILQKLEWGDKLDYRMNLKARNILIPAQTIQVLVEYCIDYGLRGSDGGTIYVDSWDNGSNYVITVGHDGRRFDITAFEEESAVPGGISFSIIKNRLADLVGGEIEFFRRDGGGNMFRIILPVPKKGQNPASYRGM